MKPPPRSVVFQYVRGSGEEHGESIYRWEIDVCTRKMLATFMREWEGWPPKLLEARERMRLHKRRFFEAPSDMAKYADIVESGAKFMDLAPGEILCVCNAITSAGGAWNTDNECLLTNEEIEAWLTGRGFSGSTYGALMLQEMTALNTIHADVTAGLSDHHAARTWQRIVSFQRCTPKVGRNDPCPCNSGKKFKRCCALPGDA